MGNHKMFFAYLALLLSVDIQDLNQLHHNMVLLAELLSGKCLGHLRKTAKKKISSWSVSKTTHISPNKHLGLILY